MQSSVCSFTRVPAFRRPPRPPPRTAPWRYLIKHFPQQLTALRNQKHELEDNIHYHEQVVSEQRTQISEYEPRDKV